MEIRHREDGKYREIKWNRGDVKGDQWENQSYWYSLIGIAGVVWDYWIAWEWKY